MENTEPMLETENMGVDVYADDCVVLTVDQCNRKSVEQLILGKLGLEDEAEKGQEVLASFKRFVPEVEMLGDSKDDVEGYFEEYYHVQCLAEQIHNCQRIGRKKVWDGFTKAYIIRWLCMLVQPMKQPYEKVKDYYNYERFRQFAAAVDVEIQRHYSGIRNRIGKIGEMQKFLRHRFKHCWLNQQSDNRHKSIVTKGTESCAGTRGLTDLVKHDLYPESMISRNAVFLNDVFCCKLVGEHHTSDPTIQQRFPNLYTLVAKRELIYFESDPYCFLYTGALVFNVKPGDYYDYHPLEISYKNRKGYILVDPKLTEARGNGNVHAAEFLHQREDYQF